MSEATSGPLVLSQVTVFGKQGKGKGYWAGKGKKDRASNRYRYRVHCCNWISHLRMVMTVMTMTMIYHDEV